jgi:hypothetical protein
VIDFAVMPVKMARILSGGIQGVSAGLLLRSLLPSFGMAAAMHDSDNYDHFVCNAIINSKWKTLDYGSARFSVYDGKAIRVISDAVAHMENFGQELISQTAALLFVP